MPSTEQSPARRKTREDVEELKRQWLRDPCWDIETTEGYERYRQELTIFSDVKHTEWARRARADEAARPANRAVQALNEGAAEVASVWALLAIHDRLSGIEEALDHLAKSE